MRAHWHWLVSVFVSLFAGGGIFVWINFYKEKPRPELSEQSVAEYAKLAEEENAKVENLRRKSPPFAYTLVRDCHTNWVNFEGKRVWVKDKGGLACGELCGWEPLGVYIPVDRTHYYEAGEIRAYSAPETLPEIPPGCYPPVDGTCSVNKSRISVGESVTFEGWGTGGDGTYAYSWVGDEGRNAQTRQAVTSFSTPGVKSMTVRITSNGQNIYKTCEVIVH